MMIAHFAASRHYFSSNTISMWPSDDYFISTVITTIIFGAPQELLLLNIAYYDAHGARFSLQAYTRIEDAVSTPPRPGRRTKAARRNAAADARFIECKML